MRPMVRITGNPLLGGASTVGLGQPSNWGTNMSKLAVRTSAAQKGFTLIEMSIVLVIIGLIIGGILKGQEIVESSRQKNFITQLDSTRAAVNTFVDRYRALPGDFNC